MENLAVSLVRSREFDSWHNELFCFGFGSGKRET